MQDYEPVLQVPAPSGAVQDYEPVPQVPAPSGVMQDYEPVIQVPAPSGAVQDNGLKSLRPKAVPNLCRYAIKLVLLALKASLLGTQFHQASFMCP